MEDTSAGNAAEGLAGAVGRAREREAASRRILETISASPGDERPVFDAILESACRLCDAPFAGLYLVGAGRGHARLVASRGARSEWLASTEKKWALDSGASIPRAISGGAIVHIKDLADTDSYRAGDPQRVDAVDMEGMRTFLAVPLMREGEAVGAIGLYRREVAPFAPDQITLVETFAAQAVIALDSVRRFRALEERSREVEEALAHQTATADVLGVISRSTDDLEPVFETIVGTAARLCRATHAVMFMRRNRAYHMAASNNADAAFVRFADEHPHLPGRASVVARVAQERRTIHLEDCLADPEYTVLDYQRIGNYRTVLGVPLLRDGDVIGVITLLRPDVEAFSVREIELVETFASQAVIAVENVRQFRELESRLAREQATREILEVISRSRADERPVFEAILENAKRLCDAPLAFMSIANEERTRVTIPAYTGARPEFAKILDAFDLPIEHSELVAINPLVTGEAVHLPDCSDDILYRERNEHRVFLVEVEGIRTILAVPMISGGVSLGAIVLYRREVNPFSPDQVDLARAFASQAAIAVENARQLRALAARTEEVQALNASLETRVAEQVDEIERMGRLKRFLSPQVADAIVSGGKGDALSSHRALLAILFCDIRGFTAFCETAEPEETIEVLQTYHEEMGRLIAGHGAGVDHRSGDGIMVLFNDPLPCDDPAGDALRLAIAMRARMEELCASWKRLGHRLGFGVGVSLGYATVGMVGSEGRFDYTASGTAVNLASRLCDAAADGEILLSRRAWTAVEDAFEAEAAGELVLKGIHAPVEIFRLLGPRGAPG
ncbi:GAF domain-containing protein [Limibaculum sp. M0105]|uniref:GAF domain-containing protein n=1 Tax=Thermohalobaculum xanthum TaxID=2753746 RepID=A0A8J7M689_9RHOB|nr:GAF domain-containing protein [Thermohalobaculum xanthum]MBK0398991.1 GAF domain-containing protein [Thermohalobaculum xanthum]